MDFESKFMGVKLSAVVDRIEEGKAVLRFEDGQELAVPSEKLPHDAKEGSSLGVYLLNDELDRTRREDLAKAVLNELLTDAK